LKKAQQISFANISDITLRNNNGEQIVLNANSTSGLPIRFEVLPKDAATLNANILTVKNLGTIVIVAYQDGNENYLPAQSQTRSFNVFGTLSINSVSVENDLEHLIVKFSSTGNFGNSNQFGILLSDSTGVFLGENTLKFVGNLDREFKVAVPENIIKSGNYKVKIFSQSPKIYSLELTVPKILVPKPLTPFIRQNALQLCASEKGEKYQWFRNGIAIQNAVNQCFTLKNTGGRTEAEDYYTVVIYNDNRASHASTKFIPVFDKIITDIEEIALSEELIIYPNPSKGDFRIKLNQSFEKVEIKIFDVNGKLIFEKNVGKVSKIDEKLVLEKQATGLYYLRIETEKGVFVKKINLN